MADELERVVGALRGARSLLFITGAGVSADSGLPTYRGIGGLYQERDTEDAVPIEVALSGEMLAREPALTWKYLGQIERACRGAGPNAAHRAIAAMESHFERVCVLTQNIDGFHREAGSRNLIEIHGDIHELHCPACGHRTTVASYAELAELPPPCPRCFGTLRPTVVLFGEMLPEAALAHWYRELERGFDAVFSVGTSSVFPYIAGPVVEAAQLGIPTVEINPGETRVSRLVEVRVRRGAAETLAALMARLRAEA